MRPLWGPATSSKFQLISLSPRRLCKCEMGGCGGNGTAPNASTGRGPFPLLSPGWNTSDIEARAHDGSDVGDVHRLPVVVAPREISRVMARRSDARQHLARGIVHEDAPGAGTPDVAFDVALHAVRHAALGSAVLVEQAPLAQMAGCARLHVVDPDQPLAAAIDVEQLLVRREAQAVGIDDVVDHEVHLLAVGRD